MLEELAIKNLEIIARRWRLVLVEIAYNLWELLLITVRCTLILELAFTKSAPCRTLAKAILYLTRHNCLGNSGIQRVYTVLIHASHIIKCRSIISSATIRLYKGLE